MSRDQALTVCDRRRSGDRLHFAARRGNQRFSGLDPMVAHTGGRTAAGGTATFAGEGRTTAGGSCVSHSNCRRAYCARHGCIFTACARRSERSERRRPRGSVEAVRDKYEGAAARSTSFRLSIAVWSSAGRNHRNTQDADCPRGSVVRHAVLRADNVTGARTPGIDAPAQGPVV